MTEEETYDKWGERLVDLVEGMEKDGVDAQMAVALMLDKAIDLTFHASGNGTKARTAIKLMTEEVAERYENNDYERN